MEILSIEKLEETVLPHNMKNIYLDVSTDQGVFGFDLRQYSDNTIHLLGLEQYKYNVKTRTFEEVILHEDITEIIEDQIMKLLSSYN